LLTLVAVAGAVTAAQEAPAVIFRSGVEQVAIAATVRDSRGRLVKNLTAKDFELFDNGHRRTLNNVWAEPSPASVAVLMDASGSMATKMDQARETADLLIAGLTPKTDEVAFYSFDTGLQEIRPFTTDFVYRDGTWNSTRAFGATSLWDAIGATAMKISDRQRRRAMVVITDGVDSASRMTPGEVSAIASSLDVPVYVLVITFALEDGDEPQPILGPLADLAVWTGGEALPVRDVTSALVATQQIVSELRHQYVLAFEPGAAHGWHPLLVRTRKPGLIVRARSGYMVK
jgi:Ca-activated chloride channel family protein